MDQRCPGRFARPCTNSSHAEKATKVRGQTKHCVLRHGVFVENTELPDSLRPLCWLVVQAKTPRFLSRVLFVGNNNLSILDAAMNVTLLCSLLISTAFR